MRVMIHESFNHSCVIFVFVTDCCSRIHWLILTLSDAAAATSPREICELARPLLPDVMITMPVMMGMDRL